VAVWLIVRALDDKLKIPLGVTGGRAEDCTVRSTGLLVAHAPPIGAIRAVPDPIPMTLSPLMIATVVSEEIRPTGLAAHVGLKVVDPPTITLLVSN
jgi:hypothetical protein